MERSTGLKRRILIVDDEPGITKSLSAILTISGYECLAASSATEARQLLANFNPDLIISDVIMPGMSGVELAAELCTSHPALPVILLSGNAATQELLTRAGGSIGPAIVLPKPYSPRELLRLVHELTGMAA
jgi:DNA-binding response OmpR family regulator